MLEVEELASVVAIVDQPADGSEFGRFEEKKQKLDGAGLKKTLAAASSNHVVCWWIEIASTTTTLHSRFRVQSVLRVRVCRKRRQRKIF